MSGIYFQNVLILVSVGFEVLSLQKRAKTFINPSINKLSNVQCIT